MLAQLKEEANITRTLNGATTYTSTLNSCLDLFFQAGAMRNQSSQFIADAVIRSYCEDPERTMKIVFFARDVRGGLGERRFFRVAMRTLASAASEAVNRNIPYFGEYGRFDDLCELIGTPCETEAVREISRQLRKDLAAMESGGQASLLAKWLPSVNASSVETCCQGRYLAKQLGMSQAEYRKALSALRRYTDILENRLRERDYTFDYSRQPSLAMLKYRSAFARHDSERYHQYLQEVLAGREKLNASTLFPYDIVRRCREYTCGDERLSLEAAWRSLPSFGENTGNAIAVIDGSGSMTWSPNGSVRPIDAALSLGIYFAEHNTGAFANHFITFSRHPRLVEIKGFDIQDKVQLCMRYNEVADTDLEAVFRLILRTAVKRDLPQEELPETLYIISDMEFNSCVDGGCDKTMFQAMRELYGRHGYRLPRVVFWNVNSLQRNCPVTASETGAALVSGFSPALFDMVMSGEISPMRVMESVIGSERYAVIR